MKDTDGSLKGRGGGGEQKSKKEGDGARESKRESKREKEGEQKREMKGEREMIWVRSAR